MALKRKGLISREKRLENAKERMSENNNDTQTQTTKEVKPEEVKAPSNKKTEVATINNAATDNPMVAEPVKRENREYTQLHVQGEGLERTPVPNFTQPSITISGGKLVEDDEDDIEEENVNTNSTNKQPSGPSNSGLDSNPDKNTPHVNIKDTSGSGDKEAKKEAKQLADLCLWLYGVAYGKIGDQLQFTESKMAKKAAKGQFDFRILEVQLTSGQSVKQFIAEYNQKVEDTCEVDDEFKDDIRPALTRIFISKGWGLSDDQYLIFKIAMDSIERVSTLFAINSSFKANLRAISQQMANGFGIPTAPQPQNNNAKTEKPENDVLQPEPVPPGQIKSKKTSTSDIPEAEIVPENTLTTEQVNEVIKKETFDENE